MTTTETSTDTDTYAGAIDSYVAAWNETDSAKRNELLAAAVSEDLWYRDPMLEADSRDAFSAVLAFVQENFSGHVLTRTSAIDGHRDLVRFNWALGVPGAEPAFAGLDVAKFDADGKLHRIIGFAGETVPSVADPGTA